MTWLPIECESMGAGSLPLPEATISSRTLQNSAHLAGRTFCKVSSACCTTGLAVGWTKYVARSGYTNNR
jgi:hypothetical protein